MRRRNLGKHGLVLVLLVLMGAGALGIASAQSARVEIERFLSHLEQRLEQHGYRIEWRGLEIGGIVADDILLRDVEVMNTGTGAVVRAERVSLEGVRTGRDGTLVGLAGIEIEALSGLARRGGWDSWSIAEVRMDEPDAAGLTAVLSDRPRHPYSGLVDLVRLFVSERLALRSLAVDHPDPTETTPLLAADEIVVSGITLNGVESISAKGLVNTDTEEGTVSTTKEARIAGIEYGEALKAYAALGDRVPILTLLSGFTIAEMEALESTTVYDNWIATVRRAWTKYHPRHQGSYAFTEFHEDGWTMRALPNNRHAAIVKRYFPPDGAIHARYEGRLVFDKDDGYLGADTLVGAHGIGRFALAFDISGIPDVPVRQLPGVEDVQKIQFARGGPVLEDLLVSLHDDGGLEIVMTHLAERDRTPGMDAARMRGVLADQLTGLVSIFSDAGDPKIHDALLALRAFVLQGGALTLGIEERLRLDELDQTERRFRASDLPFFLRHTPP